MKSIIVQYGIYLHGKFIIAYDSPVESYEKAILWYKETGIFHEVKKISQSSKMEY